MSPVNPNPYAAPNEDLGKPGVGRDSDGEVRRSSWWWHLPAVIVFCLGVAGFAFSLMIIAGTVRGLLVGYQRFGPLETIAVLSVYLTYGASWMIAGWMFSNRRWRPGLVILLIGILIPIVIVGFMEYL